jgi:hypothetical protein
VSFRVPEQYRAPHPDNAAPGEPRGMFIVPYRQTGKPNARLFVIASDGCDEVPWEHVSVSRRSYCPTWEMMDHVKRLFWEREDLVVQFHPPRSQHINDHRFCLHLWRPLDGHIRLPPRVAV